MPNYGVRSKPPEVPPMDHGLLEGLGDDDHPQYLSNARHDTPTRHPLANLDPNVCSEAEADGKITAHEGKSDPHPNYLKLDKAGQTLQQDLLVASGKKIDGVDLSAHTVNASAHHTDPKAQPKARVYQSTEQTIPTDVYTKVNLQTENFDVGSSFANSRFTAKKAGYHLCIGSVRFREIAASVSICAYLYKNGSVHAWRDAHTSVEGHPLVGLSDIIYLAQNDYVELYAAHWDIGNKNTEALSQSTYLAVCLLSEA